MVEQRSARLCFHYGCLGRAHRNHLTSAAKAVCELLEGRRLLTAVVVNTVVDVLYPAGSGLVSLRNAIATANASASPTAITFSSTVFSTLKTIGLSGSQLELTNRTVLTTITGPAAGVTLSGNNNSRVLVIDSGVTSNISNLNFIKGKTINDVGGGILNAGKLTLTTVTISDNSATDKGGGIENRTGAALTLTNSSVAGNTSGDGGGGIRNAGTATLSNVTLSGNGAASSGGGIDNTGTLLATDVFLDSNRAFSNGGGINNSGYITLNRGFISNCTASKSGGEGGGIANIANGFAIVSNLTISSNTCYSNGGGVYNASSLTLSDVSVLFNANTFATSDQGGGGVYNDGGDLAIVNSTIYANGATSGGGVYNHSGTMGIRDTTIVENRAGTPNPSLIFHGGGVYNLGSIVVSNSIVARNTVSGGSIGNDVAGTFGSLGFNLIGKIDGSSGWHFSDITGTISQPINPMLSALGNYLGPTQTVLPLPGSPAIDHGLNGLLVTGTTTDQRGLRRIVNGVVDIGAVEVQPPSITGSIFSDNNSNGKRDSGETGLANVTVFLDIDQSGTLTSGDVSAVTDATGTFAFTDLAAGTYRVREIVPAGYALNAPVAGFFDITVTVGKTTSGAVFADTFASNISGRVFGDINGDGKINNNELGLGLWQVYIDANNNGKLDPGERSAFTDINGNWSFAGLGIGTYVVRVVPVAGAVATKPTGGVLTIKLTAGQASTGNLIGERSIH